MNPSRWCHRTPSIPICEEFGVTILQSRTGSFNAKDHMATEFWHNLYFQPTQSGGRCPVLSLLAKFNQNFQDCVTVRTKRYKRKIIIIVEKRICISARFVFVCIIFTSQWPKIYKNKLDKTGLFYITSRWNWSFPLM